MIQISGRALKPRHALYARYVISVAVTERWSMRIVRWGLLTLAGVGTAFLLAAESE